MSIPPAVLNYDQAAVYIGVPSPGAMRQMVRRNTAPNSLSFHGRDRKFLRADLDAWIAAKARASRTEAAREPEPPRRRGRPTKLEAAERKRRVIV